MLVTFFEVREVLEFPRIKKVLQNPEMTNGVVNLKGNAVLVINTRKPASLTAPPASLFILSIRNGWRPVFRWTVFLKMAY